MENKNKEVLDSCLLPPYFAHLCSSFCASESLFDEKWVISKEKQGCTHLLPVPFTYLSLFLSLFPAPHNPLSPISFTSVRLVALFCPAEVSSSLSLSLNQSSPLFHSALHLPISNFPFFLNLLFSMLFFVLCQVLIQGTSCDPCSTTSFPLCQAFFLIREGGETRNDWKGSGGKLIKDCVFIWRQLILLSLTPYEGLRDHTVVKL